jgi:hypothetical protein
MSHRTVRCRTGQVLFTVRCASDACSNFCAHYLCTVHTFADDTGQSGGTPDSLVNYSVAVPEKPEGEEFSLYGPWCTRHCPVRL